MKKTKHYTQKMHFMAIALLSSMLMSNTYAISDNLLVKTCAVKAYQKLQKQAENLQCAVNEESITATDIDNRFYNPSAYIWYTASVCGDDHELTTLVQYFNGECY